MQLSQTQINELLSIIERNQAILIAKTFGLDFLSSYDKYILTQSGVDYKKLYSEQLDSIYTAFHLGMLAKSLRDVKALNVLNYSDLKNYIKSGEYIPITPKDSDSLSVLDS